MSNLPVAIITGASSGIGRAAAIQFAAINHHVVLAARTESNLNQTADQIPPDAVTVFPADLSDPHACDALIAHVTQHLGRLDVLANVAGYAALNAIADTPNDMWRTTLEVNLSSAWYLTRAAWPLLSQRRGIIINISSVAAKDPFPGLAAYAVAKAGLNMLTRVSAREGEPHHIRAVGIGPGAVETPMLRGLFSTDDLPQSQTLDPNDIATAMRDLVTGDRPFTSGDTIYITP